MKQDEEKSSVLLILYHPVILLKLFCLLPAVR